MRVAWRSCYVLSLLVAVALCAERASATSDYWQQQVRYQIDATLADSNHTLTGTLSVDYTNHSPDTLREIYFHLYANAFQHHSMMEERAIAEQSWLQYRFRKLTPSTEGRYTIPHVDVDHLPAGFEITGTIMRVVLPTALLPGASVTLQLAFTEQIPLQTRRSGWMSDEGVRYSMSQWYPKIAEYDREGWQTQEYIAHEFYGVWGDFDVTLHIPTRYTVAATGHCMNPTEAGHGYEQIAQGIKQGSVPPESNASGMTTWKFAAHNVHDFAWVADEYIHEWKTWDDSITLHVLYKPHVAAAWHDAMNNTEFALKTYSELYGQYPYRDFSTTMAGDGGMEYPQLIMVVNGGVGLLAHEIAHQWFYGMLGSNETRQAFMDEGFTTYATGVAMRRYFGRYYDNPSTRTWLDWFTPPFDAKGDNYRGYQSLASERYEEPLTIPHDWFREEVNAGQVYGKTQAILSMLEYTLGDDVFAQGMKNYFIEWHGKHPHLLDFQRVMERTAKTDLDWFFDEWFSTTRTVDYEADGVTSVPQAGSYKTTIHLRNDGVAVMPVDLLLHYTDGTTESATIPLAVNKDVAYRKPGVNLFFGDWDWPVLDYSSSILTPKQVSWFEIDTSWRLQDLDRANNITGYDEIWNQRGYWRVWQQLNERPPIDGYYAIARPIIWYSHWQGLEAGAGLRFGMNLLYSGDLKLTYQQNLLTNDSSWYNRLDGHLSFSEPVDWLGRLSTFNLLADKSYGVTTLRAELSKVFRPTYRYRGATHRGTIYVESQSLLSGAEREYGNAWSAGTTHDAGLKYDITSRNAHFELGAEASLPGSSSEYALATMRYRAEEPLASWMQFSWHAALASSTWNTPTQKQFWLAHTSPAASHEAEFYQAITQLIANPLTASHFYVNGDAGVRGQNATNDASVGNTMAALGLAFQFPTPVHASIFAQLNPTLFCDAGWVSSGYYDMFGDLAHNLATDAGLQISFNLESLLPSQLRGVAEEYEHIPTIALELPFYVNHPSDGTKPIAFRWAVSFTSSF